MRISAGRPVVQEDLMGCGIACVAFICGVGYQAAKRRYFRGLGDADRRGYLCRDMVAALAREGKRYSSKYLKRRMRYPEGTIVFIRRSKRYPAGHYLVRAGDAWMDPWLNLDSAACAIDKARSGFRRRLPGRAIHAIVPRG